MSGELLEFEDGSYGMAQNLEENSVSIVLFGDPAKRSAKARASREPEKSFPFPSVTLSSVVSSMHWDSPSTVQVPF